MVISWAVLVHTFNPSAQEITTEAGDHCKFEASLFYRINSRIAKTIIEKSCLKTKTKPKYSIKNVLSSVVVYTFNPKIWISEFKASLVYRAKFSDSQGYTEKSYLKSGPPRVIFILVVLYELNFKATKELSKESFS